MIRKATADDIDRLMTITKSCAKYMILNGIYQWNEHYPNRMAFVKDVENDEAFVMVKDEIIIGCVTVSKIKDKEYDDVQWLTAEGKHVYIHRLAVHPDYQGQGMAKRLMDFAEEKAKDQEVDTIRLDTFSQNTRNHKLYESRGYIRLGNIYFPKQSEHPFYCYELVL